MELTKFPTSGNACIPLITWNVGGGGGGNCSSVQNSEGFFSVFFFLTIIDCSDELKAANSVPLVVSQ